MPGSVIVSFARTPIAKFRSTLQALGQCPLPVAELQFNGDEKMDRVSVAHDCGPACAVTIDPSSLLQSGQHAAAQNGAAENREPARGGPRGGERAGRRPVWRHRLTRRLRNHRAVIGLRLRGVEGVERPDAASDTQICV